MYWCKINNKNTKSLQGPVALVGYVKIWYHRAGCNFLSLCKEIQTNILFLKLSYIAL